MSSALAYPYNAIAVDENITIWFCLSNSLPSLPIVEEAMRMCKASEEAGQLHKSTVWREKHEKQVLKLSDMYKNTPQTITEGHFCTELANCTPSSR